MTFKQHIPNSLTSLNLFSGMVGIYFAFQGDLTFAAYCIFLAAVFDFLDGFAARLLKVSSEIGKQLDSLADLVTFGVLPAFILFQLIEQNTSNTILPFIAFIIGVFSAVRLAKFNIDERQSDRFIGVPTPANALFISTLPFLMDKFGNSVAFLENAYVLVCLALICSFLLVAELPLIALKFKTKQWKGNEFRFILIILGATLILSLGWAGIPLLIITYIVLSVVEGLVQKNAP
ncbi:CDP-diacylglycerol--serine O-phosphatidyltransferase [Mongoliitalea daihaiensis]|uniref:CDP-diacylglycerol--serine O-phosphatidyltransferase n=1 Tax=Mongoliitalea daihaiensis TaxID=2782006 RepID=UPI001F2464DF|nr:CDP-diacylglycerol--serine O-phosphatidyltransferase [Mongoliitalea daihaiensis]UJP63311.1 CDP-diacylglycerol--serine O-phosphatidyltransferase [Mongoliitalea daihaiensis]